MNDILEVLKYTVPAFVVFITAYFVLRTMLANDQKSQMIQKSIEKQKIITPIRLQAYERIALFLERISPDSMIVRIQRTNMSAQQLQSEMLGTIRSEYEHNLSQQIYLSPNSWKAVKNAKENMIKLINTAATQVKSDAPAMELGRLVLEMMMKMEKTPISVAMTVVKGDINQFF